MRLLELTIRNFRGFGAAIDPIDLDGDLVLLYGPNGHGKTSLAEAIEWLFYGTTKRRLRGEEFSKAEYAGTFANAHGGAPTEVILKIRKDGRELTLARRLGDKETSATYVDGQPLDFNAVGITPLEAHYPVVAQHGLQTFVHSKPKDRRDAICAALGLDEVTSLKSALEGARASFQRTPPTSVVEARKRLAELALTLARIPKLSTLAQHWSATPVAVDEVDDRTALLEAAAMIASVGVLPNVDEALAALRVARAAATKSVFDITPIEPMTEHEELAEAVKARLEELKRASDTVDDSVNHLAGLTAAVFSATFLEFWHQGLLLAPSGDDCPMCEAQTLTPDVRAILQKRLQEARTTVEGFDTLTKAIDAWQPMVAPAGSAVTALGFQGLDAAGKEHLSGLLKQHESLPPYFMAHDELLRARRELGHAIRKSKELGLATKERCSKANELPSLIQERHISRDELSRTIGAFSTALAAYRAAWDEIAESVHGKISANDAVALIDGVGKALKATGDVGLLTRYGKVLEETQTLIRTVEGAAQKKQEALLKSRGTEVKDLYALLNSGAQVGFDMMEPANDAVKLHATSFGKRMPAAANLSECQLNCLGLAVWLMRATTPTSPFGFILLDDPVQAMDDDHAEAFVANVVPHLLGAQGKQVIVLSHVQAVIDKLRQLNMGGDVRHYHYENFERGGPVIVAHLKLPQLLAEIKNGAGGNENNRTYAVDRLRVLIEAFVRELHLKQTGSPPPASYDTSSSGPLADLFRAIPGTEPSEHAGMKDTINFCDPAHHTQVGYSVPQKTNIQPHIDRVSGLLKKYGLIS